MSTATKVNPDLAKERQNATLDVEKMKLFMGENIYSNAETYKEILKYREMLVQEVKPIFEENFYNLDREQRFQMIFKKSLEIVDFVYKHDIENKMTMFDVGAVLGSEKITFSLHVTMFRDSINVWGTPEQTKYWNKFIKDNGVFGTYIQTELGHGTYLRGLETTATFDKKTQEFILDSPTTSSIKFWPGASGKTSNFAIVMAKLIIDGKEHGIHAFIVQLRSLENHKVIPGIELGDIGRKFGFDATDNGYVKFDKLRIPRANMLMKFAKVHPDGRFERTANEILMYAAMLFMRGTLSMYGSFFLAISTTIAIRYSSVRRQTADAEGLEQQIINYQTQQYRLFPALAATYAYTFTGLTMRNLLLLTQKEAVSFENIKPSVLAKLHAISSALKSVTFGDCLKFAQSNRLCCGGHGYSASSGLSQIIQEADAGCTYEGDNVVLLLQTARYLLKCAQKNVSPHLELPNMNEIKSSALYKQYEQYFDIYQRLYDEMTGEITTKLFYLIKEENMAELNAWNQSSQQLITIARVYAQIFVIHSNLSFILSNPVAENRQALTDLFELYLLYGICDTHTGDILRLNVIDSEKLTRLREDLYKLLPKIRVNAVALTDSFNMSDSQLCSSLGAYDGNAYERLLDFAKKSEFNQKEVHDTYHKYLVPFIQKQKLNSKL